VLYDDFAHHPTAVDATLRSLRARHRRAKLVAVYEPRSATACRAMHQRAYVDAFEVADAIVLAPLGRSTIAKEERLDLERLASDLRAKNKDVVVCAALDDVVPSVETRATKGAVVVAMSNGAFGGVTAKLRERLA
jgi:UDP-N-acetylmuramate: L-alanyl-gamma-D-glutamyl-meso-diaminopimelate ligase